VQTIFQHKRIKNFTLHDMWNTDAIQCTMYYTTAAAACGPARLVVTHWILDMATDWQFEASSDFPKKAVRKIPLPEDLTWSSRTIFSVAWWCRSTYGGRCTCKLFRSKYPVESLQKGKLIRETTISSKTNHDNINRCAHNLVTFEINV